MNHWPECIDIWHEVSLGKEIQMRLNKVPRVMHGLNFYIVIYREMLKKNLLLKNCCTKSDNI